MIAFAKRHPFVALFGWILTSNVLSTVFNFFYNTMLIVEELLDPRQEAVFWHLAAPIFNGLAWPICLGWVWVLVRPLVRCRRRLLAQEAVPAGELEHCRRRLLNLPVHLIGLSCLGWLPGAIIFPALICIIGGTHNALPIWAQFSISFVLAALFTTVQTFIIIERFLTATLYPDFFQDARPADVADVYRLSFGTRLWLLWAAVALVPLVTLLVITFNILKPWPHLQALATGVTVLGALAGGLIFFLVGHDLRKWLHAHASATDQIAQEDFDVRIPGKRPDEWGRLTDRFNDMATALGRAREVREAFGEVVGPQVRDALIDRYQGLGGEIQEITVLFADIRGFTRRSAGESPDRVVELLNRFLSLAGQAIEENGAEAIKFLGDGLMALFGAPTACDDHADRAVAGARNLLERLDALNRELEVFGQEPLKVGIGIHTGAALVGSIGAALLNPDGSERLRREFTAIGETVNLGQRIEQLTKTCGGPILISNSTRERLRRPVPLVELGPQCVPGGAEPIRIYQVVLS